MSFKTGWLKVSALFERDQIGHWSHLSRFTNLLIILNISMFFLTGLVTKENYYYTFYSLIFLGLVKAGLLLPLGLMNRLWYYLIFLVFEIVGIYFLVASGVYWVTTGRAGL
jgi:hypothetical protein